MKHLVVLAAFAVSGATLAAPTASNGPTAQLEGEWRGRSLCVTTKRPACTDETVVYRIRRHSPGTEAFDIDAAKILDGKEWLMGTLACQFEASRQQLVCPVGVGDWRFRWDGGQLVGVLYDADGPFRVIRVDQVKP